MRLMQPILDAGHQIYLENWYTSHALFKTSIDRKTEACGTLRKNRVQFPKEFKTKKMARGETAYLVNDNIISLRY